MEITLEQPARARLITGEEDVPVPATLRYVSTDPLAVHVAFPPEVTLAGEDVVWTFARSLLADGLDGPAGWGDVHVWPSGRARTVLEFHSPYGLALLQFDTAPLRRFLVRTYAVVAPGAEDLGPAVERCLHELTEQP
ncbi:SsgA family sporulation/cell division regulator [Streptomyces sp. NPDC056716]|uniref:SsgA family sporulation/cell division regulator n=1 Tax=unclassified Streptomyces TaxID=2593676 RepID=UPI00368B354F